MAIFFAIIPHPFLILNQMFVKNSSKPLRMGKFVVSYWIRKNLTGGAGMKQIRKLLFQRVVIVGLSILLQLALMVSMVQWYVGRSSGPTDHSGYAVLYQSVGVCAQGG